MKKVVILSLFIALFSVSYFVLNQYAVALDYFPTAVKTCEKYSQEGTASNKNETFNILVTLQKSKNNMCTYKEKIYRGNDFQMLTCNFDSAQLEDISASMHKYNEIFKKEIAKNRIFEAKMTTNGEVFQKYLTNPKNCQITTSGKKN